jgi:hypothetical protein
MCLVPVEIQTKLLVVLQTLKHYFEAYFVSLF